MHPIDLAAFWPGYEVIACRQSTDNTLLIELEPQADYVPKCGRCNQACPLIHGRRIRRERDRDLLDQRVLLQLTVRRVDCLCCGRVTERIDWLEPASRLTQRLRVWLDGLLQLLPISHVSASPDSILVRHAALLRSRQQPTDARPDRPSAGPR